MVLMTSLVLAGAHLIKPSQFAALKLHEEIIGATGFYSGSPMLLYLFSAARPIKLIIVKMTMVLRTFP